jgi:ABC-type transport system substrate-binding protein
VSHQAGDPGAETSAPAGRGAFRLDRRRFLQFGASALALPAFLEATGSPAAAASKASPDTTAILQFGEMQAASMDPIRMVAVEYYQLYAIFDTLFTYTPNGTIVPRLVTTYTATPTKLRLNLRTGVTFQDGTPFDASAVQFSLNRVLHDPATNIAANVPMIGSVDVVNSHTVDITLTQDAIQPLLFELADRAGMIVSPTAVQKAGSSAAFSQAPVGAGPYAISGPWFTREKMSVRKWSGYWDKSLQTLGGIDYVNVIEGSRTNALRAGTMDVCTGLLGTDYQALNGSPGIKLVTGPGLVTYALSVNITKAPLDNLKVRQAISMAIDRKSMNQALTSGLGTPSYQWAAPNSPAYVKSLDKMYAYNPTKAKKLMKEAGFPDGITFTCIATTTAAAYYDTAELLQSQLKASGINMEIQTVLQAQVVPMTWGIPPSSHGTDTAALLASGIHVTGLDLAARNQCLPTGGQNPGGVDVPGALALIEQGAAAKTPAASAVAYQKLNTLMTQGVYNGIPLYIQPNITGYQSYVGYTGGKVLPESDNPTSPDFLRGMYINKGKKPA